MITITDIEPGQITGNVDPRPCGRLIAGCMEDATTLVVYDGRRVYYYCGAHGDEIRRQARTAADPAPVT